MTTLDDHDKTSFYTIRGLFCYKVMPFGLKNAGATFLWLVNKIFKKLTGDIVEVYIDDTVIKNKNESKPFICPTNNFYNYPRYQDVV